MKDKAPEVAMYCVKLLIGGKLSSSFAKQRIIWLLGEFIDQFPTLAMESFRRLVKMFKKEHECVKLEIINLGLRTMHLFPLFKDKPQVSQLEP